MCETCRKLTKNHQEIQIELLVLETEIGHKEKSEFSGIKLLKKAVEKVNKKVSGHTYVQIRNQKT